MTTAGLEVFRIDLTDRQPVGCALAPILGADGLHQDRIRFFEDELIEDDLERFALGEIRLRVRPSRLRAEECDVAARSGEANVEVERVRDGGVA